MVTSLQAYKKFGDPVKESSMIVWIVPKELRKGFIPSKIYCNKLLVPMLTKAFQALIDRGYIDELKTWDGCFNIRPIRGQEEKHRLALEAGKIELAMSYLSMHAWGLAVDVNLKENGLGTSGKLSFGFIQCFTDNGFVWGGTFKRRDPMHMEIYKI